MYSVDTYGRMFADAPRMEAYVAALRQTVTPESVVLDLGSGPGVFAMLACKFGARRVYAVEPDGVIAIAREAAAANGLSDRIEFFEGRSTEITLPEPATIIISDLRGILPWFEKHIPSIRDARTRLLAPGGVLIPRRDLVWAAVVEAGELYREIIEPWEDQKFELDLTAGKRFVTNTWRRARIKPEQVLVQPRCWTTIDYREVDDPNVRAEISWQTARNGMAHGFVVWFDSELVAGIELTNHPAAPEMIYGSGFFHFSEPVAVAEGDHIKLRLAARLVGDDYVWRWDTEFFACHDDAGPKASFKQSTFFGEPFSRAQLQRLRK